MPLAAAASTVASLSTATVTRPGQSARARRRTGSTHSFASSRSSPRPARAMPTISRGVAPVKWVCPRRACSRASSVHLCALTCGRSRAPVSAALIVSRLRASAVVSTTNAGVERSATAVTRGSMTRHAHSCRRAAADRARLAHRRAAGDAAARLPHSRHAMGRGAGRVALARRRSLWRAGPAVRADARYMAIDARDPERRFTFRLYPDGSGEGAGPDGRMHTRFRTWKEALRDDDA